MTAAIFNLIKVPVADEDKSEVQKSGLELGLNSRV